MLVAPRDTPHDLQLLREAVVYADLVGEIVVVPRAGCRNVREGPVVGNAPDARLRRGERLVGRDGIPHRAEPAGGNDIAGEGRARQVAGGEGPAGRGRVVDLV